MKLVHCHFYKVPRKNCVDLYQHKQVEYFIIAQEQGDHGTVLYRREVDSLIGKLNRVQCSSDARHGPAWAGARAVRGLARARPWLRNTARFKHNMMYTACV